MTKDLPHSIMFSDRVKKDAERAAALLKLGDWDQAFALGIVLALNYAESCVKGNTQIIYCTTEIEALLSNNQKFIAALAEEGVVEWLTPFVLTKSAQASSENEDAPQ